MLLLYSLLKRGLYLSTGLWQSEKNLPDIPKNTDSLENPCIFPKVTERDDSEEEKVEEKKRDRGDRSSTDLNSFNRDACTTSVLMNENIFKQINHK